MLPLNGHAQHYVPSGQCPVQYVCDVVMRTYTALIVTPVTFNEWVGCRMLSVLDWNIIITIHSLEQKDRQRRMSFSQQSIQMNWSTFHRTSLMEAGSCETSKQYIATELHGVASQNTEHSRRPKCAPVRICIAVCRPCSVSRATGVLRN